MSILHFLVAAIWLSYSGFLLLSPSWNVSAWSVSGLNTEGLTPVYTPNQKLVPSIALTSLNDLFLPEKDMGKYFTVYFSQYDSNGTETYIRGVKCEEYEETKHLNDSAGQYQICPEPTLW